jgi:hypothetical protein
VSHFYDDRAGNRSLMLDKLGVTGSSPVPPTSTKALHTRRFSRFGRSHIEERRTLRGKEMARPEPAMSNAVRFLVDERRGLSAQTQGS